MLRKKARRRMREEAPLDAGYGHSAGDEDVGVRYHVLSWVLYHIVQCLKVQSFRIASIGSPTGSIRTVR
jgi:hypothetical protein